MPAPGPPVCTVVSTEGGIWNHLSSPLELQSPAFVQQAAMKTGRNVGIGCYNAPECFVSNDQRSIYSPVAEAFQLAAFSSSRLCPTVVSSNHIFTLPEACNCLAGLGEQNMQIIRPRAILGFGDSFMRRIMESWMTMIPQVNQYAKETRVPENVTIVEEAPLLPCQDRSDGLQDITVIKLTAWLFRHLDSKIIPTLDGLHSRGVALDSLLVGFGIHNVFMPESEWPYWVNRTLSLIERHPSTQRARIFWMLPHWVAVTKFPYPKNETNADNNVLIRQFNDLVIDTVARAQDKYPRWTVLDYYHLTEGRSEDSNDGVHFSSAVYRWKNQILLNAMCPR